MKKGWDSPVYLEEKKATYSYLIIVALVLHVLIKLFLRVKFNSSHFQFLSYLQHKTAT